ncbi:hypothetical protein CEUSTIGMA_g13418.t1 [Chlamydomonas eustigma]|uniref:Uncharacterized protein n=1 Tax=Chlamydomonas eustigma TaxID=1157962 RepID=A0A250XSV2_9CHLO|nr:hypothetical protein CEUSTIGMA_g13418.t1 [Chlamydomonas eustigma]|eukprot:GAX86002.1 hypothetical protein CEUSTIGMA_g13418.t1 [Chlamydomonas eustigma]
MGDIDSLKNKRNKSILEQQDGDRLFKRVDLYIPVTKRNGDVEYISKRESSKNETSNGQLSVMLGGHGMMDRVLADLRASDAVTRFNKNKCIHLLYHHPDDGAYDYVRLLDLKLARAAVGYQDSSSTEHVSVPRPRYRKYGEKIQQFEEFGLVLAALRRTTAELHADESEIPEDMFKSVLKNFMNLGWTWVIIVSRIMMLQLLDLDLYSKSGNCLLRLWLELIVNMDLYNIKLYVILK